MAVNWYPGHMHKAQKEIAEIMPTIDVIIEVLDARIPYSSNNPMIAKLRGDKPFIKVLNKKDLADPAVTQLWLDYFNGQPETKAIAISAKNTAETKQILNLCQQLAPHRVQAGKQLRALICGIPNVGKSTTINVLADRIIAKTGNEPAVTKAQQRIRLENDIVLSDTPGMLWPKVENENSGYRLAATGAVKDTAMESDDVGTYIVEYLMEAYPEKLKARYGLDEFGYTGYDTLELIGRKRGCLRAGGRVEMNQAGDIVINELRESTIGYISMETPSMMEQEEAALEIEREKKAAKKAERKKNFKKRNR
ncbi:ribosome biogenesis GTPase YlqF [Saccharobesus litoralis]|uniref:Ribosome biogenesis GTPase A n=1 Tax=Saccharobesus litoralis TaxID=2172099 RepID=A0A2S0VU61_9ALTE|nr:ribosome biogenesis GTPase YlqF [Saccharobesus litoralis]AWB67757.1 ribosome biogenesis GTPase YlqF [Saccharobesus litoralis]